MEIKSAGIYRDIIDVCGNCGKKFYRTAQHVYKTNKTRKSITKKYFCSWKCYREYQKTHEDGKRNITVS